MKAIQVQTKSNSSCKRFTSSIWHSKPTVPAQLGNNTPDLDISLSPYVALWLNFHKAVVLYHTTYVVVIVATKSASTGNTQKQNMSWRQHNMPVSSKPAMHVCIHPRTFNPTACPIAQTPAVNSASNTQTLEMIQSQSAVMITLKSPQALLWHAWLTLAFPAVATAPIIIISTISAFLCSSNFIN